MRKDSLACALAAGSDHWQTTLAIKATAAQPFKASANKTKMPAALPKERNTLVAPMLPLPTVRISRARALATRKPVGMEPSKYPKIAVAMYPTTGTGIHYVAGVQ